MSHKWYGTKRWQALRKAKLRMSPYCECPHHEGKYVVADTVDHTIAHRGNPRLMWNVSNLQSMTKECHDRFKQSQEKGGRGFDQGCDESGLPLNKDHHWYH